MPFVQISQSECLIFVGRKLSAFQQNVVSFVENQLKLTESATDKNLSENARCFFDQEAKFLPFCLIWQLTIKQESTRQVYSTWTMDCCCAILWLIIFGSPWLTSTLTQRYTSTLQTFNQWDFWNVVSQVLFVTKFPVVNLYSQPGMLLHVCPSNF